MGKEKNVWDKFEEISELGKGGNGEVYCVKSKSDNKKYALKVLRVKGSEKKERFRNEIKIIREYSEKIEGIVPIVEYSEDEFWYTMPIAQPITRYIKDNKMTIEQIVRGIIQISETLEKLHAIGISHRDIKPSNIYFYSERFCLGDFGLVDFLEKEHDLTRSDKGLGAIFTIAPEMKRNPKLSDGKKADVFSLAKTMWMFLHEDEKAFDGVYDYSDASHSLRFGKYKNVHTVEIEELMKVATDNNPDNRPTMEEFKKRLLEWVSIYNDVNKSQTSGWNFLSKQLFGANPPNSASWNTPNKIIEALNVIGRTSSYNYMFFSDGGGLEFSNAESASEQDCIIINGYWILKPKKLYFEGFEKKLEWNYFLLEFEELDPILNKPDIKEYETLVEDEPGHYVSADSFSYGVYDYEKGNYLPEGARKVGRYIGGKILIVMKMGPYNGIGATDDGRHGDCTAEEFRKYIDSLVESYSTRYNNFKNNPFKKKSIVERNSNKSRLTDQKSKELKKYIADSYKEWNFSDIIEKQEPKSSRLAKFVFKFRSESNILLDTEEKYLCCDGFIRQSDIFSDRNYHVFDRDDAINFNKKLNKKITDILESNTICQLFSIDIIKCGNPEHLFTKNEIEIAMRNADDRVINRLVIDENGFAKVVEKNEYVDLFPVNYKSFISGYAQVGRYSDLSELNECYISALYGWLCYLKTGRHKYIDYISYDSDITEEKLLSELQSYYSKRL